MAFPCIQGLDWKQGLVLHFNVPKTPYHQGPKVREVCRLPSLRNKLVKNSQSDGSFPFIGNGYELHADAWQSAFIIETVTIGPDYFTGQF